jgi:hypothetical protein
MIAIHEWSIGNRVALGVVAAVVVGLAAWLPANRRAADNPQIGIVERVVLPALSDASPISGDSIARVIAAAVSVDPFQPQRTRPAVRFRPRGTRAEVAPTETTPSTVASTTTAPVPAMTLQGIAHLANGNALAVLSVRGGSAQLVRVGQSLEQFRLTRVDSSSATLVADDSTIILHLPGAPAGSRP